MSTIGLAKQDIKKGRNYYGIGCTNVELINTLPFFQLIFTPKGNANPKEYFHCDIYDTFQYDNIGEANPPEVNLRRELLKNLFKPYQDDNSNNFSKEIILPPQFN